MYPVDEKNRYFVVPPEVLSLSLQQLQAEERNLRAWQDALTEAMDKNNITHLDENTDITVYCGATGCALTHLLLAVNITHASCDGWTPEIPISSLSSPPREALEHLFVASKRLSGAPQLCAGSRHLRRHLTFLCGASGVLAVAAAAAHHTGDVVLRDLCVASVLDCRKYVEDGTEELLYGRMGFLYALLFLMRFCGWKDTGRLTEALCSETLAHGHAFARRHFPALPVMFSWHDSMYLGAAHGVTGILHTMLHAHVLLQGSQGRGLSDATLAVLLDALQKLPALNLPSGNLPSRPDSPRDSLVQFCHGAPGMVFLFALADRIWPNQNFLNIAAQSADTV